MSYKVMILAFGFWVPANHYYYGSKEKAENVRTMLVREKLAGNGHLCKVVKVGKDEEEPSLF